MRQDLQVELVDRVLTHVRNRTTDVDEAAQFSPRIYNTATRYVAERDILFRKFPLVVAFSAQLTESGSFVTHDLTGVPILVVRQPDMSVAAFLNVCRHRGAKVASAAEPQQCKRFICPYHAWSYDLDGKLHSVPEKHCFPQLTGKEGLIRLSCAERHGMIFVVPTPGIPLEIDSYLGEFGKDLAGFRMDTYGVTATKQVPGRIDWKLMVEANQESYHINFLHSKTAGRRYRSQCSLADLDTPHSRSVLVHASTGQAPLPEQKSTWRILDHADLVYFIFPNTLALWAGDGIQVISAFPQSLGYSVMQGARLDAPTATSKAAKEFAIAFYGNYWSTITEDIRVSESIQQGANAPCEIALNLGGNEHPIHAFHRNIERALNGELTTDNLSFRSGQTKVSADEMSATVMGELS